MFCGNCGKQLKDDAVFCGYCGAAIKKPTAQTTNQTASTVKPVQPYSPLGQVTKPNTPIIRTKGATQLTLVSVVLQVLNLIFLFLPTLKATAGYSATSGNGTTYGIGAEETTSVFATFSNASGGIAFALVVLVILPILLTAKLLLKENYEKPQRLLFPKTIAILAFAVYLLFLIIIISEANEYSGIEVSAGPAVAGYFYIISSVASIIILFKLSKMLSRKRA